MKITTPESPPFKAIAWFDAFNAHVYFDESEAQKAMEGGNDVFAIASMSPTGPLSYVPGPLVYIPGKLDQSCPEKIWLQIDINGDNGDRSESMPEDLWGDLTWCYESVGGQEVVYVRGDLVVKTVVEPYPSDYPECSGEPENCPENEGYGCCKPNPKPSDTLKVFDQEHFISQSYDFQRSSGASMEAVAWQFRDLKWKPNQWTDITRPMYEGYAIGDATGERGKDWEIRCLYAQPSPVADIDALKRAAQLIDSTAWQIDPDTSEQAGSLWVWAQDAAGVLRSITERIGNTDD